MEFKKRFCRLIVGRSYRVTIRLTSLSIVVAAIGILFSPAATRAQQANEKTFASPGDAALALYTAAKSNDNQALAAIFGSNANEIIHTGDDVADKKMGQEFIIRYDQMHRVVLEPDETVTLYVGAENWPLPIPLVKTASGTWYFDTTTAKWKSCSVELVRMKMTRSKCCTAWWKRSRITSRNRATAKAQSITPRSF